MPTCLTSLDGFRNAAFDKTASMSSGLSKMFCGSGFNKTVVNPCATYLVDAEAPKNIHSGVFEVLPRHSVIERACL